MRPFDALRQGGLEDPPLHIDHEQYQDDDNEDGYDNHPVLLSRFLSIMSLRLPLRPSPNPARPSRQHFGPAERVKVRRAARRSSHEQYLPAVGFEPATLLQNALGHQALEAAGLLE